MDDLFKALFSSAPSSTTSSTSSPIRLLNIVLENNEQFNQKEPRELFKNLTLDKNELLSSDLLAEGDSREPFSSRLKKELSEFEQLATRLPDPFSVSSLLECVSLSLRGMRKKCSFF